MTSPVVPFVECEHLVGNADPLYQFHRANGVDIAIDNDSHASYRFVET